MWYNTGVNTSYFYRLIVVPDDYPNPYRVLPDGRRLAYLHRVLAECAIGRYLRSGEVVHHRDGNPANNDPSNLLVCSSAAQHRYVHRYGESNAALPLS